MATATGETYHEILLLLVCAPPPQEHHAIALDLFFSQYNAQNKYKYSETLCSNGTLLAFFLISSLAPQARGESVGIASLLLSAG